MSESLENKYWAYNKKKSNNSILQKHQTNDERVHYSTYSTGKKYYLRKKLNLSLNHILLTIKSNEKENHLRT